MQYTEEHYAQMYNDLPEGLKDLVLSGRLAILVSAIGNRHGLNADQVADLEPAIEDVCLGLITKEELVDNILKTVQVDQRVANRIAAEAELEILKPFEAELVVARKQKEDLDRKIQGGTANKIPTTSSGPVVAAQPKDVSGHSGNPLNSVTDTKKVADWYSKTDTAGQTLKTTFDWDTDFAKKESIKESLPENTTNVVVNPTLENKLDVLTESINKLVNVRFGNGEEAAKKDDGVSTQMQDLLKRLERAEKENEENKKLIKNLQGTTPTENIFGANAQIKIDKERKVDIDHTEPKTDTQTNTKNVVPSGNIQITSLSKSIPIISSSVSKDTLDSIVETRNKVTPLSPTANSTAPISTKKVLTLDELISKGDSKIKEATSTKTGTLVFPGINDEKRIDIKNISQKENLRQTLLDDLEFLKGIPPQSSDEMTKIQTEMAEKQNSVNNDTAGTATDDTTEKETDPAGNAMQNTTTQSQDLSTNPFKDELLPKTKEERMKSLQDKIKALNKGVSVGGKTNISASGLDPYRL